jgi:hypothetical protein
MQSCLQKCNTFGICHNFVHKNAQYKLYFSCEHSSPWALVGYVLLCLSQFIFCLITPPPSFILLICLFFLFLYQKSIHIDMMDNSTLVIVL